MRPPPCLVLAALLSLACAGCPTDEVDDGGIDSGASDVGADSAAPNPRRAMPAPAALPMMGPCPEGWRTVSDGDGGPDTCDAFPATGLADCADHEAHFPGTAGCQRLGTVCAADGWPAELPATGVFYARAGAAPGGDGSEGAPFRSIGDALAVAAAGDIVAVAVGSYDEALVIPAGVTVRGACTEGTIISSTTPSSTVGVIAAGGRGTVVSNLTIGPSERMGLFTRGSDRAMTAIDVAITDTVMSAISVEDRSRFAGERLAVRRVRQTSTGGLGDGVHAEYGSTLDVRWLHVEGTVEFGVTANKPGTTATLEDVIIRDLLGRPDGSRGHGFIANGGATLSARRAVILRAHEVGAASLGEGSSLVLEETVIRDVIHDAGRRDLGNGVLASTGSSLRLSKVTVDGATASGLFLVTGVSAVLEDVIVRNIRQNTMDTLGRGLVVQDATLDARRLYIEDVFEIGLHAGVATTEAVAADLTVRNVHESASGFFGYGVLSQLGAHLELDRVEISQVTSAGILAKEGANLDITDAWVHDVASRTVDGRAGYGVAAFESSTVRVYNSLIEDVREVGVLSAWESSLVEIDGVDVLRVAQPTCTATMSCRSGAYGHALAVYAESRLVASNFSAINVSLCGIHIAELGTASLSDGQVSQAEIGACIQNDAQVLGDLQDRVAYRDNATNLQTTVLPVPTDRPPRLTE